MSVATSPLLSPLARAFLEGLPARQTLGKQLRRTEDGKVLGDWLGFELSSAFQPIVEARTGQRVGQEAFLRSVSPGDGGLSPWALFSATADDARLIGLDRLARSVHLLNSLLAGHTEPLFLNVHGRLLASVGDDHGRAFRRVVDALGVDPAQIVIETPLEASEQPDLLAFVLRNYRANGFRVAINVASTAQWAKIADTVWPHFVKIRSAQLGHGEEFQRRLEGLTELHHELTVIATQIEIAEPHFAAEKIWLQGYAYGRPAP